MKKRAAGRPKKEPDEVLVDLPIKVSPETLAMVEQIAGQLVDRVRGWAARKLLTRGIVAYLRDAQSMRPEDAIQEPMGAEPSEMINSMCGTAPKSLDTPARSKGGDATEETARRQCLVEIAARANKLLAQSDITIEQAAEVIMQSLDAAGDRLFNKSGGVRVMTADEWADEDAGPDIIDRSVESYSPEGG